MTVLPSLGQPEGGFSVLPKWTTETGDVVKGVFPARCISSPFGMAIRISLYFVWLPVIPHLTQLTVCRDANEVVAEHQHSNSFVVAFLLQQGGSEGHPKRDWHDQGGCCCRESHCPGHRRQSELVDPGECPYTRRELLLCFTRNFCLRSGFVLRACFSRSIFMQI